MITIKTSNFTNNLFIGAYDHLSQLDTLGSATIKVIRVIKVLIAEQEAFEKARQSIIKQYGVKQDNGSYAITNESLGDEKIGKEIENLLNGDIELPIETKINIPINCGLKPIEFIALDSFIEPIE